METEWKASEGKPWAQLVYHKSMPGMNQMCRSMLADMNGKEQTEFVRLLRKFVHVNDDGRAAPRG